ncbi:hypothetical protein [Streptomyces sp. NPDC002133]|uniref:competence protein CoiA family protein n=1 Tax=Streptomyces sp. NPDC002133 TaxID=3154409 RepID=UPI003327976A
MGHTVFCMAHGVFHTKLGIKINLSLPDLGHPDRPGLWEQLYGKTKRGDLQCLECMERDPGCPQWMYLQVWRGRRRACHFNTGMRHVNAPESPRHKALKERIAVAAGRAGFHAELEACGPDGRRRTDVLVHGDRGLKLGCEIQLSHATAAAVVKRSDIARRDGLSPLWTTDDRTAPLIERTPWARIDRMPWEDISKGNTILVRGGVRRLTMTRCADPRNPLPCPDRGYGRCAHWHGTWSPAFGVYLDDLIGLTAAGEYVPLYLQRRAGRSRAAHMWVTASDRQKYLEATGDEPVEPSPGHVDDDQAVEPAPQALDPECSWEPSHREREEREGAVRDAGGAVRGFTLRNPAVAAAPTPAARPSTFLSYVAEQRRRGGLPLPPPAVIPAQSRRVAAAGASPVASQGPVLDRRAAAERLGCGVDQVGPCARCRGLTVRYGAGANTLCPDCRGQ